MEIKPRHASCEIHHNKRERKETTLPIVIEKQKWSKVRWRNQSKERKAIVNGQRKTKENWLNINAMIWKSENQESRSWINHSSGRSR